MSAHPRDRVLLSSDLIQIWVFTHIPWHASVESADSWLTANYPSSPPTILKYLLRIHASDKIVAEWRSTFVNTMDYIYCVN